MKTNSVYNYRSIHNILTKNTVVVMEDTLTTRQAIQDVIENEFEWQTIPVRNKEEALELVKSQQSAFYIFDNCIDQNRHEGLDALQQIRLVDESVFIAIYSCFSLPNIEKISNNLEANLFRSKTLNSQQDIREIISEMLKYRLKRAIDGLEVNDFDLIDNLENLLLLPSDVDLNITEYAKFKSDPQWLLENQGKYVAFVDGLFVGSSDNEEELRQRLRQSPHRDKPRFFTKVEGFSETIDLPSSLWFDDLNLE